MAGVERKSGGGEALVSFVSGGKCWEKVLEVSTTNHVLLGCTNPTFSSSSSALEISSRHFLPFSLFQFSTTPSRLHHYLCTFIHTTTATALFHLKSEGGWRHWSPISMYGNICIFYGHVIVESDFAMLSRQIRFKIEGVTFH